jgi:hypothetical protein
MIDRKSLLDDLKKLVTKVEADLLARSEDQNVPEIGARLTSEYNRARAARRTAATYEEWRTDRITQAAVAWVLSCVFVRFLEDNDLISPPRIAGPGDRLSTARDSHQHFFSSHPRETDRDFLIAIFDELAALPGTADIFGPHNALREIPTWLSGDAAKDIIQFFQRIEANTGTLIHDFTDPAWDSRFLGDLYQDLSAFARERYALLQTPHFVEQFLLDRTLEPALDEFGLSEAFKMIDPACGSGHLVLGSFARILDRWQRQEPATPVRELVRRSLAAVHGVDINPFAVAIARFRLLLVAMRACGVAKLSDAPAFHLNIECGDSLLHTPLIGGVVELFDKHEKGPSDDECDHTYASEDLAAIKKLLRHGQYHAVMANPPYITPKDPGLRDRYRDRFATCHMKYSLAVPFMEHIFKLCFPGGFTGQITANSFMKREFGKKLIEKFFPVTDLTHVIDTSGAYIPGHGTPTVILFGRQQRPVADTVRAVMGIRGEPSTPDDPAHGLVWTAITTQVDQPGSQSEFVSVADTPRATFHSHPWSIGGGGAAELKELLEDTSATRLQALATAIGYTTICGEDEAFLFDDRVPSAITRARHFTTLVEGDRVRDFGIHAPAEAIYPYDSHSGPVIANLPSDLHRHAWPYRSTLAQRKIFGQTPAEKGMRWFEHIYRDQGKLRTPLSITFAFVATHNHFVLDRGGKVFKQSAPVIKLPADATEDDHLALLGILNSSTACFWMKQVFHNKGDSTDNAGARVVGINPWVNSYEYAGTKLQDFPLPASRPLDLARELQTASDTQATLTPAAAIARWAVGAAADPPPSVWPTLKRALEDAAGESEAIRRHRIALQEELDWQCYSLYGLLDADLTYGSPVPPIRLGERAFEIALARRVAAGGPATTWFERHGSTPITDIPAHWPADYRALVQKRLGEIEKNQNIRLIEQPEYKRRWSTEPWADQQAAALKSFLLDRLERLCDFDGRMNDAGTPTATLPPALVSLGEVATAARRDPLFMEAAEVFTGDVAFDPLALVTSLVADESVPLLPSLRYKDSGLRKRREWERVWDLQRKEDAIDARTALDPKHPQHLTQEQAQQQKQQQVGDIAVPPKYTSADFSKAHYWRLRGKLDVPKERFVSFPGILGQDGTPMIAWAGLDHLQLAKALGDFYGMVQTEYGGSDDPRLVPLLANLSELLPWVRQWHPESLPDYGGPPADFYEQFIQDEATHRSLTLDHIRAWQPPAPARAKRATSKKTTRRQRGQDPEAPGPTNAVKP